MPPPGRVRTSAAGPPAAAVARSARAGPARAAERAVSGRRAPGIATTWGRGQQPRERDLGRRGVGRRDGVVRSPDPPASQRPARRGPPSGEWAISAIPSCSQRSTIPPRRAPSSTTLSATCTAATGASSRASSSWWRLTLTEPTRVTRPSSSSRASARTDVATAFADRARGAGKVDGRPPSAARLASQSERIGLGPAVGHPAAPGTGHAALGHDASARAAPHRRQSAASSRSSRPSSAVVAPVGARSVEHRDAGVDRRLDRRRAPRSGSRSASVDRRMQPRPMRSSEGASQATGTAYGPTYAVSLLTPSCERSQVEVSALASGVPEPPRGLIGRGRRRWLSG